MQKNRKLFSRSDKQFCTVCGRLCTHFLKMYLIMNYYYKLGKKLKGSQI